MITDKVAPIRHDVEPWFMSGFDFRCLCEVIGLDRLPFPLAYRNSKQRYQDDLGPTGRLLWPGSAPV